MQGAEQAFGRWFADGLYQGLVSSAMQASDDFQRVKKEVAIPEKVLSWI